MNVQSIVELQRSFAPAPHHKAGGVDSLLDGLCCMAPAQAARIVHPRDTQIALQVQEPLVLKGGVAGSVHKGGTFSKVVAFRSILMNIVIAKHHHRFPRARLKQVIDIGVAKKEGWYTALGEIKREEAGEQL